MKFPTELPRILPGELVAHGLIPEPWRTVIAGSAAVGVLVGIFFAVRALRLWTGLHAEVARKILHVSLGLISATFPWLFDGAAPVVALGLIAAAALVAVRLVPTFKSRTTGVIDGVDRVSLGEVYFPLSVALLFWLSDGYWLLFVIPILVLTFGDALAALVGISYGRVRYMTADGFKSVEGSLAFFTVTFLAVHIPLLLFSSVGRAESLLIALMIGLIVMMLEAIAWRGLDNFFIPLGTWLLLTLYLPLPPQALLLRFGVTLATTLFVFYWRSRSTMDDAALITAALYGYAILMVGGPIWMIAPAALFMTHVLLFSRAANAESRHEGGLTPQFRDGRTHSVRAVIAVCAPSLLCLMAYAATDDVRLLIPHAVSFSAHIAKVCLSYRLRTHSAGQGASVHPPVIATALAAWVATCLSTGIFLSITSPIPFHSPVRWMFIAAATLLATWLPVWIFCKLSKRFFNPNPRPLLIELTGFLIGSGAAILSYAIDRL